MTQPVTGFSSSPFILPDFWDTIVFNGVFVWKGKFEITGARKKYKWDVKDRPGTQGATQTYRGIRPEPFRIRFYVWTDDYWNQWVILCEQVFNYDSIKSPLGIFATDVYHPSLAALGITKVVVDDVGNLERLGDAGMWVATVQLRQFFPPALGNATSTPAGAGNVTLPAIPGRPVPPALVALQARIAEINAQVASEGAKIQALSGLP